MDLHRFRKKLPEYFNAFCAYLVVKLADDNLPVFSFKRIGDFLNRLWYATIPMLIPFLISAGLIILAYTIRQMYLKTVQWFQVLLLALTISKILVEVFSNVMQARKLADANKLSNE